MKRRKQTTNLEKRAEADLLLQVNHKIMFGGQLTREETSAAVDLIGGQIDWLLGKKPSRAADFGWEGYFVAHRHCNGEITFDEAVKKIIDLSATGFPNEKYCDVKTAKTYLRKRIDDIESARRWRERNGP